MTLKAFTHQDGLIGGVAVDDQMQRQLRRSLAMDRFRDGDALDMQVLHSKEGRGPMAYSDLRLVADVDQARWRSRRGP